jgi:four helix bundle protein
MLHKELEVWKESIKLIKKVYQITDSFPKKEQFGLMSQMTRAAVSVASNIAEGAARTSRKEYIRFLDIASGSLAELDTQFVICYELKYITEDVRQNVEIDIEKVSKMLHGLMKYLRSLEVKGKS